MKNIENLLDFQQSGGITQRQAVAKFIKYSQYQTGQASRRAIDFSRVFWYRLLEDKVVRTRSTPIIQIRRCRRDILPACTTKDASRENARRHEHLQGNRRGGVCKVNDRTAIVYYLIVTQDDRFCSLEAIFFSTRFLKNASCDSSNFEKAAFVQQLRFQKMYFQETSQVARIYKSTNLLIFTRITS